MAFSQEFSLTFLTSAKPRSAALLCAQCDGNSLAVGMGKGPAEHPGREPTETWGEGLVMTQQEKHVTWSSGGRVLDLEANDSRCGGGGCWWWLVVVGVRFNCWHSNTLPQEMWIIKQHQEKSLCHHSERRKHLTNIHCVSCRKIVRHKYVKNEVDAQQAPKNNDRIETCLGIGIG